MTNKMRIICIVICVLLVLPFIFIPIFKTAKLNETQPVETNPTEVTSTERVIETTAVETIMPTIEETIPTETIPETDPTEPTETLPLIDPDDLEMLACVIYQEAGGDFYCDDCRRRVADVVLNRVNDPRFPNTIKKVLTAKGQYGRFYWTGIVWPERAEYRGEAHAVDRAYTIAEEVLLGNHSDLYGEGYVWQAEFKQGKDIIYHCGHYFGR